MFYYLAQIETGLYLYFLLDLSYIFLKRLNFFSQTSILNTACSPRLPHIIAQAIHFHKDFCEPVLHLLSECTHILLYCLNILFTRHIPLNHGGEIFNCHFPCHSFLLIDSPVVIW